MGGRHQAVNIPQEQAEFIPNNFCATCLNPDNEVAPACMLYLWCGPVTFVLHCAYIL